MSTELWQLSLVVAGALIGFCGALFSTVLNAHLAERKTRRDRLERFHELRGKRHSILRKSDDKESTTAESSAWLEEGNPDSAQIAFMIGFLEKDTAQIEGYMSEAEQSRREGEVAKRRIAALSEESGRLTIQHEQLQQELARLDRMRKVRGSGSSASKPVSTGCNL